MGWFWEEKWLLGFQALCLCWVVLLGSYSSVPVQNHSSPKPEPSVYLLWQSCSSEGHRNHWGSWLVSPSPPENHTHLRSDFPSSEDRQGDTAVPQTQPCVPTCALGAPIWNPAAQGNVTSRGEKLQWFPLKYIFFLVTVIN